MAVVWVVLGNSVLVIGLALVAAKLIALQTVVGLKAGSL